MTRSVALVHTVRAVLEGFERRLRESIPEELLVHNLLDDFLATDPARTGVFSETNRRRLQNDLANAELTGADIIVVTCSTLTPAVTELRSSYRTPVIAIDDAMCRVAAATGSRIAVLATARSTVEPTLSKLRAEAMATGKRVELRFMVSEEAIAALRRGDMALHDGLVIELARNAGPCDVVVLAQASMAHLEAPIASIVGVPVLSSPALCIAELRERLGI